MKMSLELSIKLEKALEKASKRHFGSRARGILIAADKFAVNPYDYFGKSLRRSWGYGYFYRLLNAGLLQYTETPKGRRGTNWFILTD
jgi:hypothetical protein